MERDSESPVNDNEIQNTNSGSEDGKFDAYSFLLYLFKLCFTSAVGDGANSADESGPSNPAKMAKVSNKSKKNMAKRPKNKTDD